MNKLWTLIKTDVNVTFGLTAMKYRLRNLKNSWQILLFIFVIISFIPFYVMVVRLLANIYDAFTLIGQAPYFLFLGIFASQIMVLFFGLIYVMSKYYFSNDLEQLVPLPIKPTYIVGSKFVSLMISEYLVTLPILLPFIFIYGIKGGEGLLYWLYSLIVVAFVPVLPLSLASILVMIFMRFTNLKGKKDMLRIIGGSITIAIIIGIQFAMQNFFVTDPTGDMDFLLNLATNSNLMIERFGNIFPPTMLASFALSSYRFLSGLGWLVLFLILSGLVFLLMIYVSSKIFFTGLIGNTEASSGSSRKKTKASKKEGAYKLRPVFYSIAKKELKMISKIPVYALNSIGGVIIMPLLLLMPFLTGSGGDFDTISQMLSGSMEIVVLGSIGLMAFLGIVNSIGVTTFSREGKENFWIQRVLPIKARDQIIGRTMASLAIQLLGVLILVVVLVFLIKIDLASAILIVVFGILSSVPTTLIGMIIDISRPKLNWTNPQQAMKQNLNVAIGMLASIVYIGLIVILLRRLIGQIDMAFIYAIIAGIIAISSLAFYSILDKLIVKQFRDL